MTNPSTPKVTPRYNVNANPAAVKLLAPQGVSRKLVFEAVTEAPSRIPGATVKVRVSSNDSGVTLYTRSETRGSIKMTKKLVSAIGLKAKQRYEVKRSSATTFYLVPHSKITTKAKRHAEPLLSVSLTNS